MDNFDDILSKWTGDNDVKIGISEASWTGIFDRRSSMESGLKWHEGLLNLIGMYSDDFSEIGDSYCRIGNTKMCCDDANKCVRDTLSIPNSVKYYESNFTGRKPDFFLASEMVRLPT